MKDKLDEALDEAMRDASITMETVGGRTLRVPLRSAVSDRRARDARLSSS